MVSIEVLIEAFPERNTNQQQRQEKPANKSKREIARERMLEGTDWHNNMITLVGSYVSLGCSDNEIQGFIHPLTLEGYTPADTHHEVQIAIDGARAKGFDKRGNVIDLFDNSQESSWPTPFNSFDEMLIPPRRWLYGWHYIRGFISVLAAPGGVGKTSLQITEALAIATGRELLGEPVHESTKVWIINAEDPMEEMHRRIAATVKFYGIQKSEVENRLFIDAGRDLHINFADQGQDGVQKNHELVEIMIKKITDENIGMVFIDPLVAVHGVNENDNMAINTVIDAIRNVADATKASIALVHHTRKSNGQEIDVDSVRGAGSLIGAARSARVVNRMSKKDAQNLGICELESRSIFRVDDAKGNLAPPLGSVKWRKLESVDLLNGDKIGVVTPFSLPDSLAKIKEDAVESAHKWLLEEEKFGREDERAIDWIGFAIADFLNCDTGRGTKNKTERTPEQIINRRAVKAAISEMIKAGKLVKEIIHHGQAGRDTVILRPFAQEPQF